MSVLVTSIPNISSYTTYAFSCTTFAPLPPPHTHTELYRLPGSRLATQCYDMEGLTSYEEEVPEEEGKAELG